MCTFKTNTAVLMLLTLALTSTVVPVLSNATTGESAGLSSESGSSSSTSEGSSYDSRFSSDAGHLRSLAANSFDEHDISRKDASTEVETGSIVGAGSSILRVVAKGTKGKSSLKVATRLRGRGRQLERGDEEEGESDSDSRIVGGKDARKEMFPHQVAILTPDGYFMCGGSLIWYDMVVCAAHCSAYAGKVAIGRYVSTGGPPDPSSGEEVINIKTKMDHPKYKQQPGNSYDITIYQLASPSTTATPDDFVVLNDNSGVPKDNDPLVVTGWGAMSEGGAAATKLQEVEVYYMTNNECNTKYQGAITDDMLCAGVDQGGKDACQGDSGGPIVVEKGDGKPNENVLVGVVSWGSGCARAGQPGVYARVSYFKDWITNFVSSNSQKKPVQLKFSSSYTPGAPQAAAGAPAASQATGADTTQSNGKDTTQYSSGTVTGTGTGPSPVAAPVTQPVTPPMGQSNPTPVAQSAPTPVAQPVAQPVPAPMTSPVTQPVTPPVAASVPAPTKPVTGCCWSVNSQHIGECSSQQECNDSSSYCMRLTLCGIVSKKYYPPGDNSYVLGPVAAPAKAPVAANPVAAPVAAPVSAPAPVASGGGSGHECCWITNLNRCHNGSVDGNPECGDSPSACASKCKGQWFDDITNVRFIGGSPFLEDVQIDVVNGHEYETPNGYTYTATMNYSGKQVCADSTVGFTGINGNERDCAWLIENSDPVVVGTRCTQHGRECPVTCGWCTP